MARATARGEARKGGGAPLRGSIEGGTTEIQRNIIAERVLGLPKD